MKVPSYEEFIALQKQVDQLQREIQFLIKSGGQWMDRKQAMQALRCSESTLHRLMRRGELPYRHEGKKTLFDADGVRAYIQSTRVSSESADQRLLAALHTSPVRIHNQTIS
ncbi:helix-turn-helix domain-containing protein [Spirosoma sp.]|uniref:helix-turn-helix domain-containing protein n=1 Tax=Spirosoma sp. TaxID=1899569 RepID=UPI003B3AD4A6